MHKTHSKNCVVLKICILAKNEEDQTNLKNRVDIVVRVTLPPNLRYMFSSLNLHQNGISSPAKSFWEPQAS